MSQKLIKALTPPSLDLRQYKFWGSKNGIVVVGTWWREGRRSFEPCLVLLHPHRPIVAKRTIPIVILLQDCWRWAMHGDIGDPAYCRKHVTEWLKRELLPGSPENKRNHFAIMDAINSRLPDLINMPPMPVGGDKFTVADAIITNKNTGATIEKEVTFDV